MIYYEFSPTGSDVIRRWLGVKDTWECARHLGSLLYERGPQGQGQYSMWGLHPYPFQRVWNTLEVKANRDKVQCGGPSQALVQGDRGGRTFLTLTLISKCRSPPHCDGLSHGPHLKWPIWANTLSARAGNPNLWFVIPGTQGNVGGVSAISGHLERAREGAWPSTLQ